MFSTILTCDANYGITQYGKIPWQNATDMKFFKETTTGHVVIMGRKTYDTIGKPLPDRINIVLSKHIKEIAGCIVFNDFWKCVSYCEKIKDKKLFVIGGSEIYYQFIHADLVSEQYITQINHDFVCDVFSSYKDNFTYMESKFSSKMDVIHTYEHQTQMNNSDLRITADVKIYHYNYSNIEETKFLNLMKNTLLHGIPRHDRTQTGTLSSFGDRLEFSLENNTFPLITTRKMFFRGIFEELMLYIRGQTDSKILEEKKISVWSANTSRAFLDSRGLKDLPIGDMGHSYGHSFRHFGEPYVDCKTDYKGKGFDQLYSVINDIKNNPYSRRLVISLWEPNYSHRSALPPCLYCYQFYADPVNKQLSCMMVQRSSDYAVAGGWNIATGALLVYLIASITGYKPHRLIWNIGDLHIYTNCMKGCIEQIKREGRLFPKLFIKKIPDNSRIEDFEFADISLIGYRPYEAIQFAMNA